MLQQRRDPASGGLSTRHSQPTPVVQPLSYLIEAEPSGLALCTQHNKSRCIPRANEARPECRAYFLEVEAGRYESLSQHRAATRRR